MKGILHSIPFASMLLATLCFDAQAQISLNEGATAPDFTVTDSHGKTHKLSDYTNAGKHVMLDFFSVTCGSCKAAAPHVAEFYQKYGCNEGDVVVLSIDKFYSTDADVSTFEATYSGSNSNPSVSGSDGGGNNVASFYNPASCPSICVIGPDQKIKVKHVYYAAYGIEYIESAVTSKGLTLTEQECGVSTAIEEANIVSVESLFPNPTTDKLSVNYNMTEASNVTFEIYDILGAKVSVTNVGVAAIGGHSTEVNVESLANGMYVLRILADDQIKYSQKFSVEH